MENSDTPLVEPGRTLGVIGAGVMGHTLIQGLPESGAITREQIWATARTETTREKAAAALRIPVEVGHQHRVPGAGMILVCVKPSQAAKGAGHVVRCKPASGRPAALGLLCKETHDHVMRIAPPLVIARGGGLGGWADSYGVRGLNAAGRPVSQPVQIRYGLLTVKVQKFRNNCNHGPWFVIQVRKVVRG